MSDMAIEDQSRIIKELKEVMQEGNLNANVAMLASESASRAQSLMARAIELIEELTGEEWNFTYITY